MSAETGVWALLHRVGITPARTLAHDIDATRARLTDTIAAHDSRDMPQDVWTALADAHHYLTAAESYLRRHQAARVVNDDAD